jgi:hypothetical protein
MGFQMIERVKQSVEESITEIESSLQRLPTHPRALTRALALLWAAHDELSAFASDASHAPNSAPIS